MAYKNYFQGLPQGSAYHVIVNNSQTQDTMSSWKTYEDPTDHDFVLEDLTEGEESDEEEDLLFVLPGEP